MFSYYGSKSKIIDLYPPPQYDDIKEVFAGSARYSLKYWDRNVTIIDKYEVVIQVWKYLQNASEKDILSLPTLYQGDDIRNLDLCDDEKNLLGLLAGVASTQPRYKVSKFAANADGRKNELKRIANALYKIRHWDIILGDFRDVENKECTWFIDPPYQFGGNAYVHNKIDFNLLSNWCKERRGQVIVCENTKADWLQFKPIKNFYGANGYNEVTTEAIWTNLPTSYGVEQGSLFSIA